MRLIFLICFVASLFVTKIPMLSAQPTQPEAVVASKTTSPEVFTADQKQALDKIIADYLIAHPDVISKALENHPEFVIQSIKKFQEMREAKEKERIKQVIAKSKDRIYNDPDTPFIGNEKGKIVFVEFLDYNCGHCREMHRAFSDLVRENSDVKVLFKFNPIFGQGSMIAARAALVAFRQGKFTIFHEKLMVLDKKIDESDVMAVAKEVGLDMDGLMQEMNSQIIKSQIERFKELTKDLEITGTPYIIYKDFAIPGAIDLSILKELIAGKSLDSIMQKED